MKASCRTILAAAALAALSATAGDKVECVCVYYPHWHRYPKGDEWFGADKWKQGEWAFVKDARRLYPNHKQPMVPYAGYLDESDPEDMAKAPTHSPAFGERFRAIACERGIECEVSYGGRNYYGDAFDWLADFLLDIRAARVSPL